MPLPSYALTVELQRPFSAAVADLRKALEAEGLQILHTLDLQQGLMPEAPEQQLLGLWAPPLGQAMHAEPQLGALLPLGAYLVAVAPGHTHVALQDPMLLAAQTRNGEVRQACKQLYTSLRHVVDRLMLGPPITF